MLRKLSKMSSFFVELIDAHSFTFDGKLNVFVVMEVFGQDLKTILTHSSKCLTEKHVGLIIYNITCALKFLHSTGVMHRDIKTANILVDEDCNIKICDFGLSRSTPESCTGKGSGNSKRLRDSILKSKLTSQYDEKELSDVISKKLIG